MIPWWQWLLGLGVVLGGVLLRAAPGGAGILDVSWIAPTTNSDGSPMTDLASYRVYYGASNPPCPGPSFFQVASSTPSPPSNQVVTFRLTGLSSGTLYYVSVTAVDTSGNESACATPASAVARIEFAVSPTGTVNFGSVNLGSFADRTLSVSNTGGGTVSGTVSTSASFSIVSGSAFTLVGVGVSQEVTVRFTPTTSATATANVDFAASGGTISRIMTGSAMDATPPTVAITSPTFGATFNTSNALLTLGGIASDNVGVTRVTWANSRGGSGMAIGTTSWMASGIGLQPGTNVLTVTAQDAAGNGTMASLTVTLNDTMLPTVAITSPTFGATYSTHNALVTLGGTASDNVGVTQVTWASSRGGSGTATGTTSWAASRIALQLGTNVLTVTAQDAVGNTSAASLTVTMFTFTDDPLTARSMRITAAHFMELRAAIDNLRAAHGLTTFAWTDPTLTPGSTMVKVVHLVDLRTALTQAYASAGRIPPTYSDPSIVGGATIIKAIHLGELRTAVGALE